MNNLFQISVFVFQSRNSQWCSLETLQKIGTFLEFFECVGQNIDTDGIFLIFRLIYSELNNIGTN